MEADGSFNQWHIIKYWFFIVFTYYLFRSPLMALLFCTFFIPFEAGLFSYAGAKYNFLTYAYIIFVLKTIFFNKNIYKGFKIRNFEFISLILVLWNGLTIFWSGANFNDIAIILTLFSFFISLFIYSKINLDENWFKDYIWAYSFGVLTVGFYLYLGYQTGTFFWDETRQTMLLSSLGSGFDISQGVFARQALVAVFGMLAMVQYEEERNVRILAISFCIIFSIFVFLTSKRAPSSALIISLLIWLYYVKLNTNKIYISSGLVFSGVFAILVINYINPESIIFRLNTLIDKIDFFGADSQSLLGLRFDIWSTGLLIFKDYPIIGIGIGNFENFYSIYSGDDLRGAHNVYLVLLVETGLVGLSVFILLFIIIFSKLYKLKDWRHISLPWLCSFLICIFFAGYGRAKEFFFAFGISLSLANYNK